MKASAAHWLPLAVVASFLAVGIPYWLIPYGKLNLPSALLGPGLFVVVLSALLLRSRRIAPYWRVTWTVGAAVPIAVMIRVVVGGVLDPTSHNLWPLEVVIASIVGFGCALMGTTVGSLLAGFLGGFPRDVR